MTLTQLFTAIANAIRAKKGTSGTITASNFPTEIASITTGVDTTDANAVANDIVTGKTAYVNNVKLTGTYTGIVPTGTKQITQNGTVDVSNYANANVNVPTPSPALQSKSVTITENGTQTITPDSGYDGLDEVEVTTNVSDGGSVSVTPKDVNFYDYDGTITDSYTKSEFLALSALPSNPSHSGLTAQGWNWSLLDAQTYVNNHGKLDISQMYITDDGKTRLYIHIETNDRKTIPLCFRQSIANGIEVDWGDGSTVETFSGSGTTNIKPTHEYNTIGDYIITLNPLDSCILTLGSNSSSYTMMGAVNDTNKVYYGMLNKVEIGKNVTSVGNYTFSNYYSLKYITIPSSITSMGDYTFQNCYSLKHITIPNGITIINTYMCSYCYSLKHISIPNSVTSIKTYAFQNCYSLNCVIISDAITTITSYAFAYCNGLSSVLMSANIATISNYCFSGCTASKRFDFSQSTSIPTISSGTFSSIASDCQIIVPDDLYDDWIAANNWSNHASKIVKASEV